MEGAGSSVTPADLDELDRLADAATPGLRSVQEDACLGQVDYTVFTAEVEIAGFMDRKEDAQLAAALPPEHVKALTAALREAWAERDRLKATLSTIRACEGR